MGTQQVKPRVRERQATGRYIMCWKTRGHTCLVECSEQHKERRQEPHTNTPNFQFPLHAARPIEHLRHGCACLSRQCFDPCTHVYICHMSYSVCTMCVKLSLSVVLGVVWQPGGAFWCRWPTCGTCCRGSGRFRGERRRSNRTRTWKIRRTTPFPSPSFAGEWGTREATKRGGRGGEGER